MAKPNFKLNHPIVMFGNGEIPHHSIPLEKLKNASTLISLDGGCDKLLNLGLNPDFIIGDLDSLKMDRAKYKGKIILMKDQSKTDLEKGIEWLINEKIQKLELIGCSSNRDDHHLANLLLIEKYSKIIEIKMTTNWSVIRCLNRSKTFKSIPGQVVSIIPKNNNVKITTEGLKYSLKNEMLSHRSEGISNVALGKYFSLAVSQPVWIIINHI